MAPGARKRSISESQMAGRTVVSEDEPFSKVKGAARQTAAKCEEMTEADGNGNAGEL